MLVDLHMHSTRSDGTLTYEQLVRRAAQRGVALFSVTDHNVFPDDDALKKLADAYGLHYLSGCEIDCRFDQNILHILAYGCAPTPRLAALTGHARAELLRMSEDLVVAMQKDYPQLSAPDYARYVYDPARGGWKGIRYLIDRKAACDDPAAMRLYGAYGCDYPDYDFPLLEEVCTAIIEGGGAPVLAHPGCWFSSLDASALGDVLRRLFGAGIRGIECYYPQNSEELTNTCIDFCEKHDLVITAGCDCHGDFLRIQHGLVFDIASLPVTLEQLRLGSLAQKAGIGE